MKSKSGKDLKNETNEVITVPSFRMNRRTFMKLTGATMAAVALGKLDFIPDASALTPSLTKFTDPLITAIPTLRPDTYSYPGKDYYEIYMSEGTFKFSSGLGTANTWGYGSNYKQGRVRENAPAAEIAATDAGALANKQNINVFLGYLGPTIEAQKGRPVVVKYINNLPTTSHPLQSSIDPTVPDPMMYPGLAPGRATPHLHGGFTDPRFDGHPHSWFTANGVHGTKYSTKKEKKVAPNEAILEYSNEQPAANLWYHDHAMGITRLNVYAGLAALYFIRDNKDTGKTNNPLGLPAAPYEIPLVIQDKQFNADGSLFYPTDNGVTNNPNYTHPIWVPEFFGDTAVVNAVAFPYLNVEPRRYRFRFLNGSQARFYGLQIVSGNTTLPLWVIGMEQSFLPAPVKLDKIVLAPAERADIIVDFTGIAPGTVFTMTNDALAPFPGGGDTDIPEIMQFKVIAPLPDSQRDRTKLPAKLQLPKIRRLVQSPQAPIREIVLKETTDDFDNPIHVRLNERWFSEPVEETPKVGQTETWQFINLTGDAHPMHMHLVKFQVVSRQNFDVDSYTTDYLAWVAAGRNPATKPVLADYLGANPILPPAPEESGWKDTAKAYPGQILRVISKFDLPPKVSAPADYVYHCHILEHEENEMMRPMQVVH